MGQLISLRMGHVLAETQTVADECPADPWATEIGGVLKGLSTPGRVGEVTPLRRTDAELALSHLLRCRDPAFWDTESLERARALTLRLMTALLPAKREYVAEKIAAISNRRFGSGRRAAEAWVTGPLDAFTDDLRADYDARGAFLNDNRLAYLRAVFLAFLFEANATDDSDASTRATTPCPDMPMSPAPAFRPRR